jgi:hypothetical protein
MATLNEFLDKALAEGTNKAFMDQIKKGGGMEGGPGTYEIFGKISMTFKTESEEEAMGKASDLLNKLEKQNRKLGVVTEIDGIDGPM